MKYSFNMNEEEKLQYEEYCDTVKLVWSTSFANGFVSDMVDGFNNINFIGTTKEYYKTLEEFDGCDSKGKVIGSHSFTLEEWEAKNPPLIYPVNQHETHLDFLKSCGDEYKDEIIEEEFREKKRKERKREIANYYL